METKYKLDKIKEIIKSHISHIENFEKDKNKKIVIGISGIPGSGKSSFAAFLKSQLNSIQNLSTKVIPLDGFHKYRRELNEEQIKFRGRIDTFDLESFEKKLKELRELKKEGEAKDVYFPSFVHELKDPKENDIKIEHSDNIIIIEGLYLFVNGLNIDLDKFFDLKIFLESDLDKAMERVAFRNFEAGISNSLEDSIQRVNYNDKVNAEYVLKNSNFENTILIKYID